MLALKIRIAGLLKQVVAWLVNRDYLAVEARSRGVRLSADMMRQAIDAYGRTLVIPPETVFSNIDNIRVTKADEPTLSIRLSLWTVEEGRSDLTLECTVIDTEKMLEIEIDDIHVL